MDVQGYADILRAGLLCAGSGWCPFSHTPSFAKKPPPQTLSFASPQVNSPLFPSPVSKELSANT